ncbi:uncharacterized protein [Rutidosis leptorrhynchoides]|uniref:uncharacterized protein n=1 Tax=Rutidosis leptorrhynchoides TaxID=125765 RepID=UPI003A9A09DF
MVGALVYRFQIQFLATQETMVKHVSQPTLNSIWKHHVFDAVQAESNGRLGGLFSIWRTDYFTLIQSWVQKYWIATILRYIPNNTFVLIINVYAPQHENKKKIVWSQLTDIAQNWLGPLFILRDFNSVCSLDERLRGGVQLWPHVILITANPKSSDHKPIIWGNKLVSWGPKPFRFNNSWLSVPGFLGLCEAKWCSYLVFRWAAFIIGNKLRLLKADLNVWSLSTQHQDIVDLKLCDAKIKSLKRYLKRRDLNNSEWVDLVNLKKCKKNIDDSN